MHITKETKEGAEVVLSGTLPANDIQVYWDNALNAAKNEVSVPGFRKGHVPEDRLLQEVGEDFLWKQAADMALREALPEIMKQEEVNPIAPMTTMLKEAQKGEDVGFSLTVITPPTCDIGDYKKIAMDALAALPADDTAKEKTEAIQAFRMQVRGIAKMKNPEDIKEGDAKENEAKADTPLSDDEATFAGFENGKAIEHFIEGEAEKAVKDRTLQKQRGAVAEALIAAATANIPRILVDEETKALLDVFKRDVVNQGLEWNEYLKRIKKDESQVTADLAPQAEKRITLDLVFGEIMKQEELTLGEESKEKEEELAHALVQQGVPHERAHSYAKEQLLREKIWEVLGVKSESST